MKSVLKIALIAVIASSVNAMAGETITGAGSTAIYPLLSSWSSQYQQKTGIGINYQAIGSGGGIKQIESGTVGFAGSDKPLSHQELAANKLVQFPQIIITIVPVVHLPNVPAGALFLDGRTLAGIYLGKIAKWNDPAIKALNPKLSLPDLAIITVHRADGSGTTFNFASYLSAVSPEWRSQVGADTSVAWPGGIGAKGNAGVAESVNQAMGSIGYVEYAYARQNGLAYAGMINGAGNRIEPTMAAFEAAAASAQFPKARDFTIVLGAKPAPKGWPITAATYILMRKDYPRAKNRDVLKFLDWALRDGQSEAIKLDYVPLAPATVAGIEISWTLDLKTRP